MSIILWLPSCTVQYIIEQVPSFYVYCGARMAGGLLHVVTPRGPDNNGPDDEDEESKDE